MHTGRLKLEYQLCFPIYATSRIITKLYQPHLIKIDLTYPQYLVLMVLWEKNSQSVSDICSLLLLETNTLTPLLKRLEGKGFIRRARSSSDERSVIVELTEKGIQTKEAAAPIPSKVFESIKTENISLEDLFHVKSVLTEIIRMKS
nr:MarR family transcriptional regulator [Cytophagales bacterium]